MAHIASIIAEETAPDPAPPPDVPPPQTTAPLPKQRQRAGKTPATKKSAEIISKPGAVVSASKTDLVLKKLRTSRGAAIETLMEATGWQAHSVRGFLSATVRKKLGLQLSSEVGKDGTRRYRIDGVAKGA